MNAEPYTKSARDSGLHENNSTRSVYAGVGHVEALPLRSASHLLNDVPALVAHMHEYGYLYLENFLPREEVESARQIVLDCIDAIHEREAEAKAKRKEGGAGESCRDDGARISLLKYQGVAQLSCVSRVLEHPRLFTLFGNLFSHLVGGRGDVIDGQLHDGQQRAGRKRQRQDSETQESRKCVKREKDWGGHDVGQQRVAAEEDVCAVSPSSSNGSRHDECTNDGNHLFVCTTEYKWLRAVWNGGFTGVHTDEVFFGRNARSLLTAWIPFGDINPEQGTLLISEKYHKNSNAEKWRNSYGQSSVGADGERSGWLTDDPSSIDMPGGMGWRCSDMRMGDVVILPLSTLHMSTTNKTQECRISCDTRWVCSVDKLPEKYTLSAKREKVSTTHIPPIQCCTPIERTAEEDEK